MLARELPMSSDFTLADEDVQGQPADKDTEKQERVKAKNRRAQKRYREKKLQETDHYKLQVSMGQISLYRMQASFTHGGLSVQPSTMKNRSLMQIKELNARLRQMAEDKRAVQKDRDRLERIVKSTAESSNLSSSAQVCLLA